VSTAKTEVRRQLLRHDRKLEDQHLDNLKKGLAEKLQARGDGNRNKNIQAA